MPGFLRQATAGQSRAIGPFVDDTDFKTVLTSLTIANTDIQLVINGAAAVDKNAGGGTHRGNGVYGVTFDEVDSALLGEIEVSVLIAGAWIVFDKFFVIEEAVYDLAFAQAHQSGSGIPPTGDTGIILDSGLEDRLLATNILPEVLQYIVYILRRFR